MQVLVLLLAFAAGVDPERMEWTVDGVAREALVYAPSGVDAKGAAPVVFAFHGHGGTMARAVRSFGFQDLWPEAVVVYLQGLPTPGKATDPEGKRPGWQHGAGDQGDRDLQFFDAVLVALRGKFKVDEKRIYAAGHSNGGQFTYLLGGARPDVFAALAPSATSAARLLRAEKPLPLFHAAGMNDPLVTFASQRKAVAAVRALYGCEEQGRDWAKGCTSYASAKGAPVVTFFHSGGHEYPAEAPPLIVQFFKEHARK